MGFLGLFLAWLMLWPGLPPSAHAKVIFDGSLGKKGSLDGPNYEIGPDRGQRRGHNLFHSFRRFDLHKGESATFLGPDSIDRIIARITGGDPSRINGRISCDIHGADIFFINPWGVIFGADAVLDTTGSFYVSTADYLRLGDHGLFNARHPSASLLTSDRPSAFGFTTDHPARVRINGAFLEVASGETLAVVAGNISILDSVLYAPYGRILLASVASSGEAVFEGRHLLLAAFDRLGTLLMRDRHPKDGRKTRLDVSGEGSGLVWIRSGRFVMEDSLIQADTYGGGETLGGVNIDVRGDVTLDGSQIFANTDGKGDAGDILLRVGRLFLRDQSVVSSTSFSAGNAGNIRVRAEGSVRLQDHSNLYSEAWDKGDAGEILMRVGSLLLANVSGINSKSTDLAKGEEGQIDIRARKGVVLEEESIITTETGWKADAGDILIRAQEVRLERQSEITSSSAGKGAGGEIRITARDSLVLTGFSEIESRAYQQGDAGSITVEAGNLTLKGGSTISTRTEGSGDGGDLYVHVRESADLSGLCMRQGEDGAGRKVFRSGLVSDTEGKGDAGDIYLQVGSLNMGNGAEINAGTHGSGLGGRIDLEARDSVSIHGYRRGSDGRKYDSRITSAAYRSGPGGDIRVQARNITLENRGTVSAASYGRADAGNISMQASRDFETHQGYIATSAQRAGGGNIEISAGDFRLLDESLVTASVTRGEGSGGNVRIRSRGFLILLDNSRIYAKADRGYGGDLTLRARYILLAGKDVLNASSKVRGREGKITVDAPPLNIEAALVDLPESFLDADALLPRRCAERDMEEASSFLVLGRDGVPPPPDQPLK